MKKDTTTLSTKKRIQFFLGIFLLSALFGMLSGYLIAMFDTITFPAFFQPQQLLLGTRTLLFLIIISTFYLLYRTRRLYQTYRQEKENEETDIYRQLFRHLEYATILSNITTCLAILNLLIGIEFSIKPDSMFLTFSLLDLFFLMMAIIVQVVSLKTTQTIRQYKLSAFPTIKEIRIYFDSFDEGEKEANYQQSFNTLFQLNQYILPLLYILLFVLSFISQQVQLTAYLIVAFIHIYINLMQYKMVRNYFR